MTQKVHICNSDHCQIDFYILIAKPKNYEKFNYKAIPGV